MHGNGILRRWPGRGTALDRAGTPAMSSTNPGDKTSTTPRTDEELAEASSEEVQAAFWKCKRDALVETESRQIEGRYEIGINGRAYPAIDCEMGAVGDVPAFGVVLLTDDISGPLLLGENNPLRIMLDGLAFVSTVAKIDVTGPIVTAWLTEPSVLSAGHDKTARGWYLEDYTTGESGKQVLIGG